MPAFADELSGDEIAALSAFVKVPLDRIPSWGAAEIAESRTLDTDWRPVSVPVFNADPLNLFLVVETGDHHVSVLDGDSFAVLDRFPTPFAVHGGPKFTPDGRFVFIMSRDGWVQKYDVWGLTEVGRVRAGLNSRNIAISRDGKHLAVANYLPRSLTILSTADLSVQRVFDVIAKDGTPSRVSAVYQAPQRDSFILALKDAAEIWEIATDPDAPPVYEGLVHSHEKGMVEGVASSEGLFALRRIETAEPIDDFFFTPDYRNLIGAARDGKRGVVVNLNVGREIAELPLPGMPHGFGDILGQWRPPGDGDAASERGAACRSSTLKPGRSSIPSTRWARGSFCAATRMRPMSGPTCSSDRTRMSFTSSTNRRWRSCARSVRNRAPRWRMWSSTATASVPWSACGRIKVRSSSTTRPRWKRSPDCRCENPRESTMSGTKSPSPPAPATDARLLVIVAHGSPSDPWPQERAARVLACRVACLLPGWRVEGATLAADGSLASALKAAPGRRPLVYPLFMSDGWFVSTKLPELVMGLLQGEPVDFAAPLGTDAALHALCAEKLRRAVSAADFALEETTVLLAAHGSRADPRPAAVARCAARYIADAVPFREVRVGFIEGEPGLADAAAVEGPALCLLFFAARAGHVKNDIPEALAAARFTGPVLDPVGLFRKSRLSSPGHFRSTQHVSRLRRSQAMMDWVLSL